MLVDHSQEIPKAITPCPIKSVVVEIRYNEGLDPNLAIGVLNDRLKSQSIFEGKYQALATTTLPPQLMAQDPNLKYAPLYQITNEEYAVRLAKNALSVCLVGDYKGWEVFFSLVAKIFNLASEINLFKDINRVGIMYTSYFIRNILPELKLDFKLNGHDQRSEASHIRTQFIQDDLNCSIFLSNRSELLNTRTLAAQDKKNGSSITIDVSKNVEISDINECIDLIEKAHLLEKKIFFSLVTEDFLKQYQVIK